MLTLEGSRQRQQRLLAHMTEAGIDAALICSPRMVYYFTGALVDANWPQAFVLRASGSSLLVTNREPGQAAAENAAVYTGYTVDRPFGRHTMHQELTASVRDYLASASRTLGLEAEFTPSGLVASLAKDDRDLTPALIEMRRPKDADEIASIREVIRLTEAGYAAAKARVEAGMTEIEAYTIIHTAIAEAAGTSFELRGDFACGTRAINGGGPPRRRRIATGDLYVLDLFPVFNGYTCDLCRTFVIGTATEQQREVWEHVLDAHDVARRFIHPGFPTRAVYEELRAHLDTLPGTRGSFTHHAGHGVGMEGWEQPWLNRGSDQTFVEGEVIACEPGLYGSTLNGGIRLEHNYLVTANGPEPLDTFPMEL